MIKLEDMLTAVYRLRRHHGIGFSWVLDNRAIVREEEASALQKFAADLGCGDRWAGFGIDGAEWHGDELCVRETWGKRRAISMIHIAFNHALAPQLPEAIVEVLSALGYTVEWNGDPASSIVMLGRAL